MNLIDRIKGLFKAEQTLTASDRVLLEWLGIDPDSGRPIRESTYFTCLRLRAETLGKLPLRYYQKTEQGKVQAPDDDLSRLLTVRPNALMTPTTFWSTVERNCQEHGNAYVWLRRNTTVDPRRGTQLYTWHDMWVLPSEDVTVMMDDAGVFANAGKLFYRYTDRHSSETYVFPQEDILHFKTSATWDGILGKPVKAILAGLIDGAKGAQDYQTRVAKNGMTGMLTMEYTDELDKARRERLCKRYDEYIAGARNTNGIVPVPYGLKLVPISMKMADSQFLDLRKYGAQQIAAAFGIKPNQINDYQKASYASSESQQLAFLTETMTYTLKAYEEEINYKCFSLAQIEAGYYFKFNVGVLLRTDQKTQADIIRSYVAEGIYTHNEARDLLDKPYMEGGDVLMVNGTYIPLKDVGKQYDKGGE